MIRRVTAVALGAFMLHLNVERADLVCAQRSGHAPAQAHVSHASSEHQHVAANGGHDAAGDREKCPTPSRADCCQALQSCAMMPGLNAVRLIVEALPSHDRASTVAQSTPQSRSTAPEPPPPKA